MAESQNTEALGQPTEPVVAEPIETPSQPVEAPVESQDTSKKLSPEEFQAKLAKGEIDTTGSDPETLIQNLVEFPTEEKQDEPVVEARPKPVEQKQEHSSEPRFQTFREMLDYVKNELGESYGTAAEFVKGAKNKKEHLKGLQEALERWKTDATTNKGRVDQLVSDVQRYKAEAEAARQEAIRIAEAQKAAPQPTVEKRIEEEEPEIPKPTDGFEDAAEAAAYYEKVRARDQRIIQRKMQALESTLKREKEETKAEYDRRVREEQHRIRKEEDARRQQEIQSRHYENVVTAADDFVNKFSEFKFEDGKTVKDKDADYAAFVKTMQYITSQNPSFQGRNLTQDYINGVPDAVDIVSKYGVQAPVGMKQYALLVELNQICDRHDLYVGRSLDSSGIELSRTGKPDFEAAYALKKRRDGVDVDELNKARTEGAREVMNVVHERQSSVPNISASEVSTRESEVIKPQQVMEEFAALNKVLPTLSDTEGKKRLADLEAKMAKIGIVPQSVM